MEGGMMQNTVKQMRRIYGEEGIETMAKELKKRGMEENEIKEIASIAKKKIHN